MHFLPKIKHLGYQISKRFCILGIFLVNGLFCNRGIKYPCKSRTSKKAFLSTLTMALSSMPRQVHDTYWGDLSRLLIQIIGRNYHQESINHIIFLLQARSCTRRRSGSGWVGTVATLRRCGRSASSSTTCSAETSPSRRSDRQGHNSMNINFWKDWNLKRSLVNNYQRS